MSDPDAPLTLLILPRGREDRLVVREDADGGVRVYAEYIADGDWQIDCSAGIHLAREDVRPFHDLFTRLLTERTTVPTRSEAVEAARDAAVAVARERAEKP